MSVKIGINGFGRIGRNIFRAISKDPVFQDIEVVGIKEVKQSTDMEFIDVILKDYNFYTQDM